MMVSKSVNTSKDDRLKNPRLLYTVGCISLIFFTYVYFTAIPSFNADDISNIQFIPRYYAHGRWATFAISNLMLELNPVPILSTFIGATALYLAFFSAAQLLRFGHIITSGVFILLSSISFFWGALLSFDAFHISYPLAAFFALYGLHLLYTSRWKLGVICLIVAPAFYQASIELAAVVFIAKMLRDLINSTPIQSLRAAAKPALGVLLALICYKISLEIGLVFGVPNRDTTNVDPFSFVHRWDEIVALFRNYSLPLWPTIERSKLGPAAVSYAAPCLFAAFSGSILYDFFRKKRVGASIIFVLLSLFLLVAPFCLIFFQARGYAFTTRSLYAFSCLHAFWGAFLIERWIVHPGQRGKRMNQVGWAVICLTVPLIFLNSLATSKFAFDSYLSSQTDLLATDRLIARIEDVMANNGDTRTDTIPILMIYRASGSIGPRGDIPSVRQFPWARERIFYVLDQRLVPFGKRAIKEKNIEKFKKEIEKHESWPASDSVFPFDGAIVVVTDN